MKKLDWIFFSTILLMAGSFSHIVTRARAATSDPIQVARMRMGGAQQITKAIHKNTRQSLRPRLKINSRYSVPVLNVKITTDGKTMAMLGEDNRVHLWNLLTGQKFYSFSASARVTDISFLPQSRKLLISNIKGIINIVNFNNVRAWPGQTIKIHSSSHNPALHPDGRMLALVGIGYNLELWQINHEEGLTKIKILPNKEKTSQLIFSGDGSRLLSVSDNGRLTAWDWQKEKIIFTGQTGSAISSLAVLPGSLLMAAGCKDGRLFILDLSKENPLSTIPVSDFLKNSLTGLTFISNGSTYLVGCDQKGGLYKWELPSGKLLFNRQTDNKLLDVAGIPGHEYFFTAGQDHILRFCALSDGQEVAKLIVLKDGWAVLSANGCFDGTLKNAPEDHLKALSWFCDKRKFTFDGFIANYYQPALLGHLLAGNKPEPLHNAPVINEQEEGFPMPPLVNITTPGKNEKTSERILQITLKAEDQDHGLHDIRLYHNGNFIDDHDAVEKIDKKTGEIFKTYHLVLLAGTNHFKAVALNKALIESEPAEVSVITDWQDPQPQLHILTVGISKYNNPRLNLHYSRRDAEEVGKILLTKKNPLYSKINIHHLYDAEASRAAIYTQLAELEKLPPQDTVLIYLAGHGETLADEWFFIPYELRHPENTNWLKKSALSSLMLELYIAKVGARRVFLVLDSCKSGAIVKEFADFENHRSMALLSRLAGIHVISASTQNQYAGEFGQLKHGLFTYTLLEGLHGSADRNPADGNITVSEVMGYVETQMPILIERLTLPAQRPLANSHGEDFPIVENSGI